jgi:radical SAM/Cys-rich protein
VHATLPLVEHTDFPQIRRLGLETVQVNVGYRCNQSCVHCHVNAGPTRTEQMSAETMADVLRFTTASGARNLDLTGGAPELNPHFRDLVTRARAQGLHVMDRCNLTVLEQPDQEGLADFLAAQRVEIIASLPCYLEDNVDRQRGKGVFDASIRSLQALNARGYGVPASALALNLVYNPQGPVLPPPQAELERDYRKHLGERYGIRFNALYVLANMPIQRFGSTLISKGGFDAYIALLKNAYQRGNLDNVMCRSLVSIDWQGYVYDCDFNQMLGLPLSLRARTRTHVRDLVDVDLEANPIAVADHCYGCTAGQGSSCGGALAR